MKHFYLLNVFEPFFAKTLRKVLHRNKMQNMTLKKIICFAFFYFLINLVFSVLLIACLLSINFEIQ